MMKRIPFVAVLAGIGVFLLVLSFWDLAFLGLHRVPDPPRWSVAGGDVARGREVIQRYGCGACHVIPGIRSAQGRVGPKLEDFRDQIYVGGVLANTPENLVRWIQIPQDINPMTAMPSLGLTEQDARDAAAYLYANP